MKLQKSLSVAAVAASLLWGVAGSANAATVTLFGDRADFITAMGATPTLTQDFNAMAVGTNLTGVQLLPQITLSTNLSSLEVFNSAGIGNMAFAIGRNQPEAVYTFNFSGNTTAFGFDITAFDPATPGPGFLSVYFADGDLTYTLIPVLPTNATEQTPIFFGIMSNSIITRITWSEGPELDGFSCCEETGIDNLITAGAAIPEPGSWALAMLGLGAAGWQSRRRRLM
jgi:hypothetical protein